jgi:hypothetical protein
MSDRWRIVTRFPDNTLHAHARARESDNSKNLSLPVTCHSVDLNFFPPNGEFHVFPRLKIQAGYRLSPARDAHLERRVSNAKSTLSETCR